jgi:hypothetical protein
MDNHSVSPIQPVQKKNKLRKFVLIFTLSLAVIWFIYYFICGLTYSEGTRSGILTKVSRKGYVFKTYEGEMNIGGFSQGDGTIMPATMFKFSIMDKKIYDELEAAQGNKVVLHYKQVYKNFFWQGDTDYFIHEITHVK